MPKDFEQEDDSVSHFREYLRIPSVHPNINYDDCVSFLKRQALNLGLPVKVFSVVPGKPIVVLSWEGKHPELPSVLLNSHMDVVPVYKDKWDHDPFGAHKDNEGNIYGRGSQDMKSVGIQYLEAVRRLRAQGVTLSRTVHISFVPDEEIGGEDGMQKLVHTSVFVEMNVGVALDEGVASPEEKFILFNGERSIWHVAVHCPGSPGHGSLLLPDTAGEKLRIILDRFFDWRESEKRRLECNPILGPGGITTLNLTLLEGGVQSNVVPPELSVVFDIRVATDVDHEELERRMEGWCREAGKGTHIIFLQKDKKVEATKLDEANPWWQAFKAECDGMELKVEPIMCPGGTDARYVRAVGLPVFGFSPMNKTPTLLHAHNEFLNEAVFLRGIDIYSKLIPALANVE